MVAPSRQTSIWLFLMLVMLASPARAVVVYDLVTDFSNASNPNGTWTYLKGNVLLGQFSPVPGTLSIAAANGYWGSAPSDLSGAVLQTTANGSTTSLWSDNDFLSGDVLVSTGGSPVDLTWTAPSNGTFTYSGSFWYADAPSGPGFNDFVLSLNAGPTLESGSAGLGQDRPNAVNFVNGSTAINVSAGDIFRLSISPSITAPFGSLAGASLTIDFLPAAVVPEPDSATMMAVGGTAMLLLARGRRRSRPGAEYLASR